MTNRDTRSQRASRTPEGVDIRPWYREPWPWVLIAIPLTAVAASMVTLWLAITRPDHLVVDEATYNTLRSELKTAQPTQSDQPRSNQPRSGQPRSGQPRSGEEPGGQNDERHGQQRRNEPDASPETEY